jgi:hypothetical protein
VGRDPRDGGGRQPRDTGAPVGQSLCGVKRRGLRRKGMGEVEGGGVRRIRRTGKLLPRKHRGEGGARRGDAVRGAHEGWGRGVSGRRGRMPVRCASPGGGGLGGARAGADGRLSITPCGPPQGRGREAGHREVSAKGGGHPTAPHTWGWERLGGGHPIHLEGPAGSAVRRRGGGGAGAADVPARQPPQPRGDRSVRGHTNRHDTLGGISSGIRRGWGAPVRKRRAVAHNTSGGTRGIRTCRPAGR